MGLRILVVLPMYGGSLPIGRYCAKALSNLGMRVRIFDAPALYPGYKGLLQLDLSPARLGPLQNSFLRFISQAAWQQIEDQNPQLVLALAQAPLDRHILQRLRQAGIPTVMWFVEDYRLFTYWQTIAPLYDAFAVIQKDPFLEMLRKAGQEHGFYLPLAMLPEFHRKLDLSDTDRQEYGSAVSFLGAGYPNRRNAFAVLADRDFKIWGSDWNGEEKLARNIQREGERISEEEAVKIYNATDINLNLHSSIQAEPAISGGDFVNPRTFELAGIGAFQLADERSLLPELFGEDEVQTFADAREMVEKIEFFSNHPEERARYAAAARARALAEHTYEKRMYTLLEYMSNNFGPFNLGKEAACSNPALSKIARKFGLPEDADCEDILAAMRRQHATLEPEEAALLFQADRQ